MQALLGDTRQLLDLVGLERYMHAKARPQDIERLNAAFGSVDAGV
jgi:hypothetical protein